MGGSLLSRAKLESSEELQALISRMVREKEAKVRIEERERGGVYFTKVILESGEEFEEPLAMPIQAIPLISEMKVEWPEISLISGIPLIASVAGFYASAERRMREIPPAVMAPAFRDVVVSRPLTPLILAPTFMLLRLVTARSVRLLGIQPLSAAPRIEEVGVKTVGIKLLEAPALQNPAVRIAKEGLERVHEALALRPGVKGLVEALFGEEAEKLSGAAQSYAGEPVFIVARVPSELGTRAEKFLWFLLWVICREMYREARGEYPEALNFLGASDAQLRLWLSVLGGRFSGHVVILRERQLRNEDLRKFVRRRLQEAYSQGLGFAVILAENVDECTRLIRELAHPFIPRVVVGRFEDFEKVQMVTAEYFKAFFGIPSLPGQSCDEYVAQVDREYRNFIESLLRKHKYLSINKSDIGRESEDHLALKVAAIMKLEELGATSISVTHELGLGIVPDIYAKLPDNRGIAVEVETLYGTGPQPMLKIAEKLSKYVSTLREESVREESVSEVWLVLRNWSVILHLRELVYTARVFGKRFKEYGRKLRILLPDLKRKELVDLHRVLGRLQIES